VFDSPKKNLNRLDQELLAQEQEAWAERQNRQAAKSAGTNETPKKKKAPPAPKTRNRDKTDVPLDRFSEDVREPRESLAGLVLLACILMLGILAVAAWWLWYLL